MSRAASGKPAESPAPIPEELCCSINTPPLWRTRLPDSLFWAPQCVVAFFLSLWYGGPTVLSVVNPGFADTKTAALDAIAVDHRRYVPPYSRFTLGSARPGETLEAALEHLAGTAIPFPVVAKPENGFKGYGVKRLSNEGDLQHYLSHYSPGESIHFQQLVTWPGEAGAFYVRHPGSPRGRLVSLTLKAAPCAVGDGSSTLRELIRCCKQPARARAVFMDSNAPHLDDVLAPGQRRALTLKRNMAEGAKFVDLTSAITPGLTETIDSIAQGIPNYHYGRFDLRFPTIDSLLHAQTFKITEVNSAFSADLRIDSRNVSYLTGLFAQFPLLRELFAIGAANVARGWRPKSLRSFVEGALEGRAIANKWEAIEETERSSVT